MQLCTASAAGADLWQRAYFATGPLTVAAGYSLVCTASGYEPCGYGICRHSPGSDGNLSAAPPPYRPAANRC